MLLLQIKSHPVDAYESAAYKKNIILFCSLLRGSYIGGLSIEEGSSNFLHTMIDIKPKLINFAHYSEYLLL